MIMVPTDCGHTSCHRLVSLWFS